MMFVVAENKRRSNAILWVPAGFFLCWLWHLPSLAAFPPIVKPIPFQEVFGKADFIGIVEISTVPGGANGSEFLETSPPEVACRPVSVLKGEVTGPIHIRWQTKKDFGGHTLGGKQDKPIRMPTPGEYMVYLKRGKENVYERFSEGWSFRRMPPVPNVVIPEFSLGQNKWRAVTEVAPFISQVGDKVHYRFYRTRLDDETFEGAGWNWPASVLTVIDFTRKQVLLPKQPGMRVRTQERVAKGGTVVHEIELTRHFDLSRPGEYWVLEQYAPLRFEVSNKVQIRTPEK